MKKVMTFLAKWMDREGSVHTAPTAEAEFSLSSGSMKVGTLSAADGKWKFRYSDEFRHDTRHRAIVEFPDTEKVYESEVLWPFFETRIPSLKQPGVQDIMRRKSIDASDEVGLLKEFGRRTVANSLELQQVE